MKTLLMILLFPALLLAQTDTLSFLRVRLDQESHPGLIIAISTTSWGVGIDTIGWNGPVAKTRLVVVGDVFSEPDSLGNREIWYGYRIQHQPGRVDTLNNVPCSLDSTRWKYVRQLLAGEIVDGVTVDSAVIAADSAWRAGR